MIERSMSQERLAQVGWGIISRTFGGEQVKIDRAAYQHEMQAIAGLWLPWESTDWFYGPHGGSCMSIIARYHKQNPWMIGLMIVAQLLWMAFFAQ